MLRTKEVDEALKITVERVKSNSFQHFWEDGITERGARAEDISVNRRTVLVALGELARHGRITTKEAVIERCSRYGLESHVVDSELREFVRRQVLIRCGEEEVFQNKVYLFEKWLMEKGIEEIITTFTEHCELLLEKKIEMEGYIKPDELSVLSKKWVTFRGVPISPEDIRAWLLQFGDNRKQRLIFNILNNLRFYDGSIIREKMKEAHGIVKRGLVQEIKGGRRKRDDILVSYIDGPGKSGAQFAKLYLDENQIYFRQVVEKSKIGEAVKQSPHIKAIVFLDDIIGTGNTAVNCFRALAHDYGDILQDMPLFFIALCGFDESVERVARELDGEISLHVHVCDVLNESDKCFSDDSKIYPNVSDRAAAQKIVFDLGKALLERDPLGYGNCQAAIVFEHNCPNNTLPVLWKETTTWRALFKRQ